MSKNKVIILVIVILILLGIAGLAIYSNQNATKQNTNIANENSQATGDNNAKIT